MQKFEGTVTDGRGNAVNGATIAVKNYPGNTAAAIYRDNGTSLITGSSVTSNASGYYSFYAANGHYSRTISGPRLTTTTFSDFELYDRADDTSIATLAGLAAPGGSALVGHISDLTDAVATTLQEKERQKTPTPQEFMTDAQRMDVYLRLATLDVTASFAKMLASGRVGFEIPPGWYLVDNLQIPNVFGLTIKGQVGASVLVQKSGGNPIIKWDTSAIYYGEQHIDGLMLKGTNGASHCINTSGAGGLTLSNIYIRDVPTGYSGIYVNGAAATYVHDIRINGLQVYSNTAGHSGVRFGPLVADTSITDFIMNGNFVVNYCAYYDVGAVTVRMSDSHPYNASINALRLAGSNDDCAFNGVIFDNATTDIARLINSSRVTFTDCWFEAIKSGYCGIYATGCSGISGYNCRFTASAGALSAAKSDSSSPDVKFVGGSIGTLANYTTVFDLAGVRSFANEIGGVNPLGMNFGFSGATTAAQAQNTTQFLGINGGQSAINNTYYLSPETGTIVDFHVEAGSTPAAGQTFTFNLQKNGSTIGTITLNNGQFGDTLAVNTSVTQYDNVAIQSVFSATSGSSSLRYAVRLRA